MIRGSVIRDIPLGIPPTPAQRRRGRKVADLNPAQQAFMTLTCFTQVYFGGWGAGKSSVGVLKGMVLSILNPRSVGLVTAPRWKQVERLIDLYWEMLDHIERTFGYKPYRSRTRSLSAGAAIVWNNGSRTVFMTAWNIDAILAQSVTWAHVDEIEFIRDATDGLTFFNNLITRVREKGDSATGAWVRLQCVMVTSTARWLTGLLKELWDRFQADDPDVAVVRAPSTVAVGYGLSQVDIERFRGSMNQADFDRMVMCRLGKPPGLIYADYVSEELWPLGNVIDWPKVRSDLPLFCSVDWGKDPHVLWHQYVEEHDLDVYVAEWGIPVASGVPEPIQHMQKFLERDGAGHERPGQVFPDITDNPGQGIRGRRAVSERGITIMRRAPLFWPVSVGKYDYQRSIDYGIGHVRNRLHLNGKRRIAFATQLMERRRTRMSDTTRGVWSGVTELGRYKLDPMTNEPTERQNKTDGPNCVFHALDALRTGQVVGHRDEFKTYFNRLTSGGRK